MAPHKPLFLNHTDFLNITLTGLIPINCINSNMLYSQINISMITGILNKIKNYIYNLVPAHARFKAIDTIHRLLLHKFKQTYYSQNGEDVLLKQTFPKLYSGFYVDVGAHHPYRISNTYLLYRNGWHGINIDANPETISMFKRARPNDTNLNIGISSDEQLLTYHRFSDPAVNTFSDEHAEKFKHKNWISYVGSNKIKTTPLRKVFAEHLKDSQKIDVLSVDVEGLDLEVLQSNDWVKYRPHVVVVEALDFELEKMHHHPLYSFLHEQGYNLIDVAKFSLIFRDSRAGAENK